MRISLWIRFRFWFVVDLSTSLAVQHVDGHVMIVMVMTCLHVETAPVAAVGKENSAFVGSCVCVQGQMGGISVGDDAKSMTPHRFTNKRQSGETRYWLKVPQTM